MKALILSLALLTTSATLVAQAVPSADTSTAVQRGDPHKAAAKMGQTLGLTADQQARVEPILAARRQKVAAVRANTQLSDAERQQQLKAIHREARLQLSSVLTPDQVRQLKALHHAKHTSTVAPAGA